MKPMKILKFLFPKTYRKKIITMNYSILVCSKKEMVIKGEVTTSVCRSNTDRSSEYKLLNKWAMQLFIEQIIQERIFYCSNKTLGQFIYVRSLHFVSNILSKHSEHSTEDICSLTNLSILVIVVIYQTDPAVLLRSLPKPLKSKEALILMGTRSRFSHSTCPWAKTKLPRRLMLRALFWLHNDANRQDRKNHWAALKLKVYVSILNCKYFI